jgi:glycosyltransferase involved in cell wall biosynthesis
MTTTVPRVSVCVPSYNHSRFLPQALESILRQTFSDLEIIIVDDGSTDNSLEIAKSYASNHPSKIKLHTHPNHENLGISATVNAAFKEVRGEYWMGLPSDDLLHPQKIARQVEFLDQHQEIGWVYSYANFVDNEGQLTDGLFGNDVSKDPDPVETLIQGNQIPGMTALMRRSVSAQVGLHNPSLLYSDWHYWVRMAAASKVGFIPEPLVYYRLHDTNTSIGVRTEVNIGRFIEVTETFRKDVNEGRMKVKDRTRALIELQMAYYFKCLDQEAASRSSLSDAFAVDSKLLDDRHYLRKWIRGRCELSRGLFETPRMPSELVRWLISSLPAITSSSLRQRLEAEFLAQVAIENAKRDPGKTRLFALKSVITDPNQLVNKRLQRTVVKAIAGEKTIDRLRRFKRKQST